MRFVSTMTAVLSVMGVALAISLSAAPPKPSVKGAEDPASEVPAVPYLTLALARDRSVHEELGLESQGIMNVQAAIAEVDEQFWRLRDTPVTKCEMQLSSLQTKLMGRLKLELTQSQFDRFLEIVLQGRGWKALISREITEQLSLTSDQVTRLRVALADAIKERESAEKGIAEMSSTRQEQIRAKNRASETQQFMDILTRQQQAYYRKLLGRTFDFSRVTQVGCVAPELRDVSAWINTDPITLQKLRGNVVVVHFWAFGCINCIRNLPHYQSWHDKFGDSGLTIVGVQTPETESERQLDNLRRNVIDRDIKYPVVFDATSENWKAWGNNMWPSVYLINKQGRVRNWWYGELNWEGSKGEEFLRSRIQDLLAEKRE